MVGVAMVIHDKEMHLSKSFLTKNVLSECTLLGLWCEVMPSFLLQ